MKKVLVLLSALLVLVVIAAPADPIGGNSSESITVTVNVAEYAKIDFGSNGSVFDIEVDPAGNNDGKQERLRGFHVLANFDYHLELTAPSDPMWLQSPVEGQEEFHLPFAAELVNDEPDYSEESKKFPYMANIQRADKFVLNDPEWQATPNGNVVIKIEGGDPGKRTQYYINLHIDPFLNWGDYSGGTDQVVLAGDYRGVMTLTVVPGIHTKGGG